jgi:hypothetical protein
VPKMSSPQSKICRVSASLSAGACLIAFVTSVRLDAVSAWAYFGKPNEKIRETGTRNFIPALKWFVLRQRGQNAPPTWRELL